MRWRPAGSYWHPTVCSAGTSPPPHTATYVVLFRVLWAMYDAPICQVRGTRLWNRTVGSRIMRALIIRHGRGLGMCIDCVTSSDAILPSGGHAGVVMLVCNGVAAAVAGRICCVLGEVRARARVWWREFLPRSPEKPIDRHGTPRVVIWYGMGLGRLL